MRKYNNRTKKTMIIIGILCVALIIIFSYAIKKSIDIDKTAYEISSGSILFDKEYNMLTTSTDGILRIKWGGDYYLKQNDKDHDIGTHAVIYNTNNGDTALYGKFYEVTKEGEVEVIKGENLIKSSVNSKFFKLADRKYLIIDRTIESSDSSFVTSNYLIVNLDKLGNATLLNDKTSYKTIKPTILRTSAYVFDIANEKINFGGEDIDLKKIIGSTNEYDEDTYDLNANIKDEDGTGSGSGEGTGSGAGGGSGEGSGAGGGSGPDSPGGSTGEGDDTGSGGGGGGSGSGNGTGGDGTGTGTGSGGGGGGNGSGGADGTNTETNGNGTTAGGSSTSNNNYDSGISDETVQEIVNATKNTSVIRVTPNISSISIDYVVYDPENEYKSVYVEIENSMTNQVNVVYLSKTDTNINISDLTPNVYYNLTFKYSYYDDKKVLKEYKFDEVGVFTEIPKIILTATKITNNKLYYKITLDKNYTITGGTINLYLNDQFTNISGSISAKGNVSTITGDDCYIDLSNLDLSSTTENVLNIRLVSLSFNTYTINPGINYKFKY